MYIELSFPNLVQLSEELAAYLSHYALCVLLWLSTQMCIGLVRVVRSVRV